MFVEFKDIMFVVFKFIELVVFEVEEIKVLEMVVELVLVVLELVVKFVFFVLVVVVKMGYEGMMDDVCYVFLFSQLLDELELFGGLKDKEGGIEFEVVFYVGVSVVIVNVLVEDVKKIL